MRKSLRRQLRNESKCQDSSDEDDLGGSRIIKNESKENDNDSVSKLQENETPPPSPPKFEPVDINTEASV